jgi:two-component system response regulator HydG
MAKILVVDDDNKTLKLLRDFLEHKGHEVTTASGGKEALEKIAKTPDIVLLDIMMPDVHGIKVLDKIKETAPSIEIIMVTALAEHAVGIETMKRGAFDFVTKPIDLKHLEELINFKIMQKSLEKES